ncbi:three-Cys-motif partner protein TcmP [Ruficoccus sp. ZRK36]|uniref:three-Cys-motif partner protein TcmP n=1 Tax=Ruficoccus sp. ZRK36 TaxID=2866311 RepID=UPI001C7350DA|nr:three-Cys-motif partner protein TcmP [Ruficoccus sp. ZRK36]QYY34816.1 three-Cys-motif partner protein TcmP [Ruficoccus sp. ZRK36]
MATKAFIWKKDGSCPDLEPHSQTKLEVLRDYVVDYLKILVRGSMGQEIFKITLVDAFAGGGRYSKGEDGSPLTLLKAVKEAEALINLEQKRTKPLKIEAHYYFVEKNKYAFDSLKQTIKASEWSDELSKKIYLIHDSFENVSTYIVEKTKARHPNGGSRVIFFLDQCGWAQVNATQIAQISQSLNYKCEFILNFACDWLAHYINGGDDFRKGYDGLGLSDLIPIDELLELKEKTQSDYRYVIAAKLGPALQRASKSPFFSPFYVEPTTGSNHGYWLVHLAPHIRARNAMIDVYHRKQTHIRAFGNTGLRMLAYNPDSDPSGYLDGFDFSDDTITKARLHLGKDLIQEFVSNYSEGTTFSTLCLDRISDTIANTSLLSDALVDLAKAGEININGPNGGIKRCERVEPGDIIKLNRRPYLTGMGIIRNGLSD